MEINFFGTLFEILGLDQATQNIQKMLSEMNACIECFLNKHQQKDEGINWFLEACKEGLSARFLFWPSLLSIVINDQREDASHF